MQIALLTASQIFKEPTLWFDFFRRNPNGLCDANLDAMPTAFGYRHSCMHQRAANAFMHPACLNVALLKVKEILEVILIQLFDGEGSFQPKGHVQKIDSHARIILVRSVDFHLAASRNERFGFANPIHCNREAASGGEYHGTNTLAAGLD
jgi:hypothetical protein